MRATRILLTLAWVVGLAGSAAAQGPEYAGADSCKTCHQAIYDSWAGTKHAKALSRLSGAEKKGDTCIGCHVTGSAAQIAAEGENPKFPGVQCESCHGPGSLHVADAKVMTGLSKKPSESACTKCHNDKGPHFHGFVYVAMAGFSHPVKK
jgi:hypothetical protein